MTRRLAVLVDGDNLGPALAEQIMRIAQQAARADTRRVYTDASRTTGWHSAPGFRLIHAGTGKNAADVLLSIEAMELSFSGGYDSFLIASSDGDFSHIAHKLRDRGHEVLGAGEAKAPPVFRDACTAFFELGAAPAAASIPGPAQTGTACPDLDRKVRAAIARHGKNGAGMPISLLNGVMHAAHGTRISNLPDGNWRSYLTARPSLYDVDPKGKDAKVRLRT